jgi:uncharacterized cofD-like protein
MTKIVTIGGGTGSFMLLSGLKKYPIELSAIVSMSDDGGSTGVLRDELGVLPPGDVRQCLVALSDASDELRAIMNYRFTEGGLKGQSFGNLFLSALEKTHKNFLEGVRTAMGILKVKGEVIPVTGSNAHLHMELRDGTFLEGEDIIDHAHFQEQGVKKLFFRERVKANPRAVGKILNADVVVIGPGDLYGSILSNLIVPEIAKAIRKTRAKIIYNANLTNKKGHTSRFSVDDYVDAIENTIGKGRIDFVTFNTKNPAEKLIQKYSHQEGKGFLVEFDEAKNPKRTYRLLRGDFLKDGAVKKVKGDALAHTRSFIRHDADKLAKAIMECVGVHSLCQTKVEMSGVHSLLTNN